MLSRHDRRNRHRCASRDIHKPENLQDFIGAYVAERKRLAKDQFNNRERLLKDLAQAEQKKRHLVNLYCEERVDLVYFDQEIPAINRAIEDAKAALAIVPPLDNVRLNDEAIAGYSDLLQDIGKQMSAEGFSEPTMERVREFIGPVIVKKSEAREPVAVQLYGSLGLLRQVDDIRPGEIQLINED
jgi:hypothetical protein